MTVLGAAAGNGSFALASSSPDFLPSFQKLRLLGFVALSGFEGAASDASGSAEDFEDAEKASGRRGAEDPRDSVVPVSLGLTDCSCCALDILETRG